MADRLKFGLYGLLRGDVDPGTLAQRGQLAEQAGFESLWVGDHIALPGQDGEQPRLEVVVAVSYLAAVTATVRLGFGVIVLPQLRQVAACCERPARLGDLEITITPPGRVDAATARQYAELGVHRLVPQPVTEDGSDMAGRRPSSESIGRKFPRPCSCPSSRPPAAYLASPA
jgi:hypothetical protein